MTAKFQKLRENGTDIRYCFECPGCECRHWIRTEGPEPCWQFNGDVDRPTVSPSVLVNGHGTGKRCHSFIKDGQIQFLSDCDHALAGQTVDLPELD